jgi:beta-xylosidase
MLVADLHMHVGNAINRPGQLSLRAATTFLVTWEDGNVEVATGGLYAPTIRHHNGTTYIICTNVVHNSTKPSDQDHTENFIVHTADIWSDKWSDPVYYDFEGIDPSIFFDDDGKAYVQGTQMPQFQIYNMEVELKTGKMLAEPKMIWAGVSLPCTLPLLPGYLTYLSAKEWLFGHRPSAM